METIDQNGKEQTKLRLNVDIEKIRTHFADFVQVETGVDSVAFNFIERTPGNPPEDFPNATISSRVVLTWPHFARLAKSLQEILEAQRDEAKQSFDTSVFPSEK